MSKISLHWNYDKVASDPLTAGKLYYRKPFQPGPILVGMVQEIAPRFNVSHQWGNTSSGIISGVLNSLSSFAIGLGKSFSKELNDVEALTTGNSKWTSNKLANIVNDDMNNKFKQYEGSSYEVVLPTLTIMLLPTDKPEKDFIDPFDTPAGKLSKLMSFQANFGVKDDVYNDGDVYSSSNKVGPELQNEVVQAQSENDKKIQDENKKNPDKVANDENSPLKKLAGIFTSLQNIISNESESIQTELSKLNDTKLIGSSAYFGNQVFSIAPFNFYRNIDYSYPVYLKGTVSLVVNGVIYRNLLIESVETECSKTRIIQGNKDMGPSWIKIELKFVPAIQWTVRDVEDIILQLANSEGYDSSGLGNISRFS